MNEEMKVQQKDAAFNALPTSIGVLNNMADRINNNNEELRSLVVRLNTITKRIDADRPAQVNSGTNSPSMPGSLGTMSDNIAATGYIIEQINDEVEILEKL